MATDGVVVGADDLLRRYAEGDRNFAPPTLDRPVDYSNLRGADLSHADLSGVDLSEADLHGANLAGANLAGANLSAVSLFAADLTGANLSGANLARAKIMSANLSGALLSGTMLRDVSLYGANLSGANLTGANLWEADLSRTTFTGANLSGATFRSAKFDQANLRGANLTRANLIEANMTGAVLADVIVFGTVLGKTILCDVDLTQLCRGEVTHHSPSIVDFRAIIQSVGEPRLKDFLRSTGIPDVFAIFMIDCARTLDPRQVFTLLQSTFISYGGPDEAFARRLNDALEKRGVTTFFFEDDAPAGERMHRVMRKGVNDHDRVILVCSESSLQRAGLLNELEETLARESRDGGRTYLLPIRLDDYVLSGWKPADAEVATAVRDRVIADFRQHDDPAQFEAGVSKLVAVLKRPVAPY
jgi:hypothetical protein